MFNNSSALKLYIGPPIYAIFKITACIQFSFILSLDIVHNPNASDALSSIVPVLKSKTASSPWVAGFFLAKTVLWGEVRCSKATLNPGGPWGHHAAVTALLPFE